MKRPTLGHARLVSVGTLVVGMIAAAAIVWQASYSAFTATTSNSDNSWTTGTVQLSNNADSGKAMFDVTDLAPGESGSRCITVTYDGSLASTVKLYGSEYRGDKALGQNLQLTVEQGTGGSSGSCTDFTADRTEPIVDDTLADFVDAHANFGSGAGSWSPTGSGSESMTFKFSCALPSDVSQNVQGETTKVDFIWEARS
jgi:hypothetical protein